VAPVVCHRLLQLLYAGGRQVVPVIWLWIQVLAVDTREYTPVDNTLVELKGKSEFATDDQQCCFYLTNKIQ
jgi:hypothetical protein